MTKKTNYPTCLCRCTAAFKATAYQDLIINSLLNRYDGGSGITERKALAQKSITFISSMLADSGAAILSSASCMMEQQGVKISSSTIEDDIYDRAASIHSKRLIEEMVHSAYLQEARKKGRMGTVVVNPFTNDLIDIRSFGNS